MPKLIQRGQGVALTTNEDKAVAWFPDSGPDVGQTPVDGADVLRMRAEGLVAQTAPRQGMVSSVATGAGTFRMTAIYLRRGLVLTNGLFGVGTNGSGVTLAKLGLWRSDGTLLAGTADFSADVNTGSTPRLVTEALSAPYTVPADGGYYAGLLTVGGTSPNVGCTAGLNTCAFRIGTALWPVAAYTGQADLANFVPASVTVSGSAPWIGFT